MHHLAHVGAGICRIGMSGNMSSCPLKHGSAGSGPAGPSRAKEQTWNTHHLAYVGAGIHRTGVSTCQIAHELSGDCKLMYALLMG